MPHFALFKPDGYISQFKGDSRKKKYLGELADFPAGTMAIGRLDEMSEGLLLLTTDGVMSEKIRSAKFAKTYVAQVDGIISEDAAELMRNGVEIGFEGKRYITQSCKVEILKEPPIFPPRNKKIRDERHGPTSWVEVVLREGKFRQVRKMTAAVGLPTLRLMRISVGHIDLHGLTLGEHRKLSEDEINGF